MKTIDPPKRDELLAPPKASAASVGTDRDVRLDVLVIEGNPSARRALASSLAHLGHLVFTTPTLQDGLQLMRGLQIDVVVCDLLLPDGNGLALMSRWPEEVRRVPAIGIGGWHDAALQGQCLGAGFDAFLAKPVEIDALGRMIRKVARRDD